MENLKKIGVFLLYFFVGVGLVEVSNLGFYLMNQSNTYLFYLGLAMVIITITFVVLTIVNFLTNGVSKVKEILKNEKEEKKQTNN